VQIGAGELARRLSRIYGRLRARDVGWDVFAEKLVERSIDVPPELAQRRRLEADVGKW
jgi:hypothetical protein